MCWFITYYEEKIYTTPRVSGEMYALVNKPEKPHGFTLTPWEIYAPRKAKHAVQL